MQKQRALFLRLSILTLSLFLLLAMTGCTGVSTTSLPTSDAGASPIVITPPADGSTSTPSTTAETPTTVPATEATSTPPAGLQTYTCSFFSVSYPDPWQVSIGRSNQVELSGPGKGGFSVYVYPDDSKTTEEHLADILLAHQNENNNFLVTNVQAAITIGGQSWKQVTWTGTNSSSGLAFKGRDAITTYNGVQYVISYSTLASDFDNWDLQYFQVMQQSFTFKTGA